MAKLSDAERVDLYADLIASERRIIKEALERIEEYAEKLSQAAQMAAAARRR